MFIVISYDVPADGRRTKIHNTLKDYGKRVQYSVFEVEVPAATYKILRGRLEKLAVPKEDKLRFYFLDADAVARIESIGMGEVERARDFYIIGRIPQLPDGTTPVKRRLSGGGR